MNINAANALLKCLEEPSPSTTLLLYSHQPSGLPATVRSRCQAVSMGVPGGEACLAWLRPQCVDDVSADELLEAAGGRPLEALRLLNEDGLRSRQAVLKGLEALVLGRLSPLDFPAIVAELDIETVLSLMQGALEASLRATAAPGNRQAMLGFELRDELARLQRSIANGANPNRQLIIEDYSTRLASALRASAT
jgi:DNA polymerase-3 subunit delta'